MSVSQPSIRTDMERVAESLITAGRKASHYFEKLDRSCLHASAYHRHADWLLGEFDPSPPQEKLLHPFPTLSTNQYVDFILGFKVPNGNTTPLKLPSLSQIHHIIREMTIGIYIFQQTPQLSFIANHDGSTTVRVTPAYNNTLVGKTLISIGYAVISLLNRFEFDIDKQSGLAENWRTLFKQSQTPSHIRRQDSSTQMANSIGEQIQETYTKMGMVHLPREPTYIDGNTRMREERNRLLEAGLLDLEKLKLPNRNDPPNFAFSEEAARKQTFLLHIDSLIPHVVGRLQSVKFKENVLLSSAEVELGVKHLQMDNLSEVDHRRIHCYLQAQREYLSKHLFSEPKNTMDLVLFKIIVFLIPLFVVLKRKGKIPHEASLLEKLEKDTYTTEKQFCPILPSLGSRWHPQKLSKLCGVKCSIDIMKQSMEMEQISEDSDISTENLRQIPGLVEREEKKKKVYHTECEDGESCYFFKLTFEDFYAVSPKIPRWVHAFKEELRNKGDMLKSSDRFSETRIQDLLRLRLGSKEVSRLKTNPSQLRKVSELGDLIPFHTLASRSTKTYMQKPGADGNNLLHLSCLYGHAHVVISLMRMGCDVNQPNELNSSEGMSPLSIAAGSGHIEIVAALVTHGADPAHVDYKGWMPLHYAAYNNYQYVVRYLVLRNPDSLNSVTRDSEECTPLLLAIQAGALDTVKQLLRLGASIEFLVRGSCTLVQWTAINCHINILRYFIELKRGDIPVWQTLTQMLKSDTIQEIECATRMLDPLSKISDEYFQELYEAGGIDALVSLLGKGEELQYLSTLVLQNISCQSLVKKALGSTQVISSLTSLLGSQGVREKLQWRIVVILTDLVTVSTCDSTDRCAVREYQDTIRSHGAISHIVANLLSASYDLRLNACYCLSQLAKMNIKCKGEIVKTGALPRLVSLLEKQPHDIKVAAAMAIASIVEDSGENQIVVLETGAVDRLVNLLFSDVGLVHNSAAHAIENIASKNQKCQDIILANGKSKAGLARLLKMKENQTKICGLFALYAIAGSKIDTKKVIANFITIPMLADMIELGDLKLELVCADALNALATGQSNNACRIYKESGVLPVFRTLHKAIREYTHNQGELGTVRERIIHLTDTVYSFLLGQALAPNVEVQDAFYENNNVHSLLNLLSVDDALLRAKAWLCLAAYMRENQKVFRNLKKGVLFNVEQSGHQLQLNDLLGLIGSELCDARIISILSLALFVFKNKPFEKFISLHYRVVLSYEEFTVLKADYAESFNLCIITFAQIVLAAFFKDISSSDAVINGIKELIHLLSDPNELIIIGSLDFLAALCRTTEGIPAAIIGANGIEHCFRNLFHQANSVARMAAVALGYLTFNATARRNILTAFRLDPYLCYMFNKHFSEGEICKTFKYEWEMTATKGLPALSLNEEILMRKYKEGFLPPEKRLLYKKHIGSNLVSHQDVVTQCKDRNTNLQTPIHTHIANTLPSQTSKLNRNSIVRDGPLMQRKLAMLENIKPAMRNTVVSSKRLYDSIYFEDSTPH